MGRGGACFKGMDMEIRDLGSLTGPVWLFGGVYSNLSALDSLLGLAQRHGVRPGNLLCSGDIIGPGADPVACLQAIEASGAVVIAGTTERQLAVGASDCGCGYAPGSTLARLSEGWYAQADRQVSGRWRDWLSALPDLAVFAHEGRRYGVVHGGLTDIARDLWPSSPDAEFTQEITAITAAIGPVDAIIAGHCGLAFERVVGGVHWINAGAIGLPPNDGRPMTRYAILAADGARLHRLQYDVGAAQAAMQAAGLSQGYDTTLTDGLWPCQDGLPQAMRR